MENFVTKKVEHLGGGFERNVTYTRGIHSMKVCYSFTDLITKIRIESNFGKSSMVSDYVGAERKKAIETFKNLIFN